MNLSSTPLMTEKPNSPALNSFGLRALARYYLAAVIEVNQKAKSLAEAGAALEYSRTSLENRRDDFEAQLRYHNGEIFVMTSDTTVLHVSGAKNADGEIQISHHPITPHVK